uniref:ATP synthase subunit a n=1 Tax=Perionyx excavatus TaxID=168854 RepID=A6YFD5_9ANNE|nr:ATP synthase F0 subunit 6 [Perionyx excavatus]ABQ01586.1 ATP synthase F0 subunit 6 [Perionyx excavatus]
MMPDIFSSFDPYSYNTLFPSNSALMTMNVLMILLPQAGYWTTNSRQLSITTPLKSTIFTQLTRNLYTTFKGSHINHCMHIYYSDYSNLSGMIPYTFSTSSHLIFTLAIGFPMWLSFILSSASLSPKKTIAHLLPDGAPDWLNPFLVIIETTSIIVHPLTLSFRLAANMSAGHIVLSLIGIYCASAWFTSILSSTMLILTSLGYVLFEFAICLIQAYIFCLLLSLYSDDHAH